MLYYGDNIFGSVVAAAPTGVATLRRWLCTAPHERVTKSIAKHAVLVRLDVGDAIALSMS